jgi:hypothetical protein
VTTEERGKPQRFAREGEPQFEIDHERAVVRLTERGFFQILREDFLPPFSGRKKKRRRI